MPIIFYSGHVTCTYPLPITKNISFMINHYLLNKPSKKLRMMINKSFHKFDRNMDDSHTLKIHVFTPYFKVARRGDIVRAKCTWDGTRTNKTTKIGNLSYLLFTLVMITSITYL